MKLKGILNSKRTQAAYLKDETFGRSYQNSENEKGREFSTEEDLLTEIFWNGNRESVQVRKLTDDIYITYKPDDNGNYTKPYDLMLRYNEDVDGSYSIYNAMVPFIQENLIPQIKN